MSGPLCSDETYCIRPATQLVPVYDKTGGRVRGVAPLCSFHYQRSGAEIPACQCRSCREGLESLCEVAFSPPLPPPPRPEGAGDG